MSDAATIIPTMDETKPEGPRYAPLSIVIEWENADRIGCARASRMLSALNAQMKEIGAPASGSNGRNEIIIIYDRARIEEDAITPLIDEIEPLANWPAEVRFAPTEAGGYYQQKNFGATLARNETLVFLDSDAVPEEGWLEGLIAPLADPGVDIVCGSTFIECENTYASAMALVWFFPLRSPKHEMMAVEGFFANNIVFRRSLFEKYNYPETGQFRGQCVALADTLKRDGHTIWQSGVSTVSHPPPEGMKHFVVRALMHGHDDHSSLKKANRVSFGVGAKIFYGEMKRSVRALRHDRQRVGLGPLGAASGSAIALSYYGIKYLAFLGAMVPGSILKKIIRSADA